MKKISVMTWITILLSIAIIAFPAWLKRVNTIRGGSTIIDFMQPELVTQEPIVGILTDICIVLNALEKIWVVILLVQPLLMCLYIAIKKAKGVLEQEEYKSLIKRNNLAWLRNIVFALIVCCLVNITNIEYVEYGFGEVHLDKPLIYIYPETETTVQVSVGYPEKLSCVYPEYDAKDGWEVIAKPNGDLVDTQTGRNLYSLYWEGDSKEEYRFKDGFVVAGKDSAKFLEEKLAILGLNEREANEFIIYWLPKLEANKYNLIRFETAEEIEAYMPLNIQPKPDTVIRVVMDFKEINRPIEIVEQKLETSVREGYTVVEWGGSEF